MAMTTFREQEMQEMRVCDPCWGSRNSPIDQHGCGVVLQRSYDWAEVCDCPCREEKHSDLDTIDLDHDLGVKWMTDPFDPHGY